MKSIYLYFALIGVIFLGGIFLAYQSESPTSNVIVSNKTKNETANKSVIFSKEELANKTLAYINNNILIPQGVTGELESIVGYGESLYTVNIIVRLGSQTQKLPPIYVTKDGKMIIIESGGIVDLLAESDTPRAPVSSDDDPYLGPKDAKVTVIEFSDFQCSYCAAAAGKHESLIAGLVSKDPSWEAPVPKLEELARQGKIRFVFRDFPLQQRHPLAQLSAEAARCANDQGKFWEMHDKLFEGQAQWSGGNATEIFKEYANVLGLNRGQFDSCLDSKKYTSEVQKDLQDGVNLGVTGTPAFFVNGIKIPGATSFKTIKQVIDAELSRSTNQSNS